MHENLMPVVLVGLVLTVFGFCIYYLLPLALLTSNAAMLFNIFLAIMIGMMVGMVLLALNLQPLLESLIISVIFGAVLFFENTVGRLLLLFFLVFESKLPSFLFCRLFRQFSARTSWPTASEIEKQPLPMPPLWPLSFSWPWPSPLSSETLFTSKGLCACFPLFFGFQLKLDLTISSQYNIQGSSLMIYIDSKTSNNYPIGIAPTGVLESWCNNNSDVLDYAWASYSLSDLVPQYTFVGYENLGQYITDPTGMHGISPNYYDVVEPGFFTPTLWNSTSYFSFLEQVDFLLLLLLLKLFPTLFDLFPPLA